MRAVLKWLHKASNNALLCVLAAIYITRENLAELYDALSASGVGFVSWLQAPVSISTWAYVIWVLFSAITLGLFSIPVTRWIRRWFVGRLVLLRQRLVNSLKGLIVDHGSQISAAPEDKTPSHRPLPNEPAGTFPEKNSVEKRLPSAELVNRAAETHSLLTDQSIRALSAAVMVAPNGMRISGLQQLIMMTIDDAKLGALEATEIAGAINLSAGRVEAELNNLRSLGLVERVADRSPSMFYLSTSGTQLIRGLAAAPGQETTEAKTDSPSKKSRFAKAKLVQSASPGMAFIDSDSKEEIVIQDLAETLLRHLCTLESDSYYSAESLSTYHKVSLAGVTTALTVLLDNNLAVLNDRANRNGARLKLYRATPKGKKLLNPFL
jgi:DNA-binding MarR family transcriptional regulator